MEFHRRLTHGKRRLLRSSRAESMEGPNRSGGQAVWKPLIRRGPARNRAGQKQAALLVGTSDSHTRRDAAVVGTGRTAPSRVCNSRKLESSCSAAIFLQLTDGRSESLGAIGSKSQLELPGKLAAQEKEMIEGCTARKRRTGVRTIRS